MKASNIIIIPLLIIQIASSKEPTQHGFGLEKKLQDAEDALSSDLEYVEQHMSWSSIFYVNHRELQQTDDDIFEKYNTRCRKESDCGDSIFLHCHRKNGHKICMHKPIFPMHESEILGTVVLTVLMALAVISGIGGGGIIVSLLMVFYKLNTKEAIAVSGFTIFLGSIARFLITINKRHPHKDAPVIDYSLANIMLPTVLVGSLFGVFLNLLLPSLVLQIFLSIVLALLAVQSGFKAVHIHQQESMDAKNNEQIEEPKQQNISQQNQNMELDHEHEGENENLLGNTQPSAHNKNSMDLNILPSIGETEDAATTKGLSQSEQQAQDRNIQMVQDIEDNERNHQQWEKHLVTLAIFIAIVLLNIYRGSQSKPSIFGVKSCSVFDWGGIVAYLVFCVFLTYRSIAQQQHEQELKREFGHGLTHSEITFEGWQLFKLLFFSFSGGLVSGALGMGGGSVFNPLLLSFGVPPQVSSATGSYMIIFSTGASTLTYILNDMMDLSYGIWAGCFCIMGSILGMLLLDMIIKILDRQSPQVFLLCLILTISAITVPILGYHTLNGKKDLLQFHNICTDSNKI